jgi:transcriptional regulator with XRE-family HTH domain
VTTDDTAAEAVPGSADPGTAEGALTRELRRLVGETDKSLRTLGAEVNVAASTISRVTTGKIFPTLPVAVAIARNAGGDPDYVGRLWAAADEERRPGTQALLEVDLEGDERELLRTTAAALKAELQRRRLSLGRLAKSAGYGKSTLSSLFRGERVPDKLMLHDVLQAMELPDAEIRNWTAKFARAAERVRRVDPARSSVDIAAALAPLQARLRHQTIGLAAASTLTVAALGLSGLALWAANDAYQPTYNSGYTTTVTAGTPVPPGPKTAVVDLGGRAELASVFEKPHTDATVTSTVRSSNRVVLLCQVTTTVPIRDPGLTYPGGRDTETNVWVKISLGHEELGFVPSIYLIQDTEQRPVLPPPACG